MVFNKKLQDSMDKYEDLQIDLMIYALREYKNNGYHVDDAIQSASEWLIEQEDARNYYLNGRTRSLMMARVIRLFPWRYNL